MPADRPIPSLFRCGDYAIGDRRMARHHEVTIRSSETPIPRRGDRFTILRDQALQDLTVTDVSRRGDAWTARCRLGGEAP